MAIVVQRSFTIERGTYGEFERLSREGIWPYMEARGCKILGLFQNVHGGPSDEVILLAAYASHSHWEATRLELPPPGSAPELLQLAGHAASAGRERNKLTRVSGSPAGFGWRPPGLTTTCARDRPWPVGSSARRSSNGAAALSRNTAVRSSRP